MENERESEFSRKGDTKADRKRKVSLGSRRTTLADAALVIMMTWVARDCEREGETRIIAAQRLLLSRLTQMPSYKCSCRQSVYSVAARVDGESRLQQSQEQ